MYPELKINLCKDSINIQCPTNRSVNKLYQPNQKISQLVETNYCTTNQQNSSFDKKVVDGQTESRREYATYY